MKVLLFHSGTKKDIEYTGNNDKEQSGCMTHSAYITGDLSLVGRIILCSTLFPYAQEL